MENKEIIPQPKRTIYSLYIKRIIGCIGSGIGLVILSPLFLIVTLLEWKYHGKPAIYKSRRPGKDNKIFTLYKFRSMTNEKDENGILLPEEERLTPFGKFINQLLLDGDKIYRYYIIRSSLLRVLSVPGRPSSSWCLPHAS